MDKNLQDFLEFKQKIDESRIDNRTLAISLEDTFGIPENMINATTEIDGGEQYHVRYKNILVIMYWDESIMRFVFPNYYGVYEEDKLVKMLWY
jgi:hypothetical protein